MAAITKINGLSHHYLSWGDTVDLSEFSVTVKLGSNEYVSGCDATLYIAPDTAQWDAEFEADRIYRRYKPHVSIICKKDTMVHSGNPVYSGDLRNVSSFNISKGGSKTIKFDSLLFEGTIGKIPDNSEFIYWSENTDQQIIPHYERGKDYFESRFPETTNRRMALPLVVELFDGTRQYFAKSSDYYFLKSRLDPVIDSVSINDIDTRDTTPLQRFGNFIQNESSVQFSSSVTFDPLDPELTAVYSLTITSEGNIIYDYSTDDGVFNVGKINASGTLQYTYTVVDSAGNSDTQTGSFVVLPYSSPSINLLQNTQLVERWGTDVNLNHVPMDDGENVWLSFASSVSSINGKNSWTIKSQSFSDDNFSSAVYTIFSGTDGSTKTYSRSEGTVNPPSGYTKFSQLHRFDFTVTVEDWFGNTAFLTGTVDKAGGYLNVEKHGVGVGMRSTGTIDNKKFEVNEEYESYFYGGISGVTNYSTDEVLTGGKWIDGKPIYRKTLVVGATEKGKTKTVPLGFTIDTLIQAFGAGHNTNGHIVPLTFYSVSTPVNSISYTFTNANTLSITAGSGAYAYRDFYMTIVYTKIENDVR